LFWFRASIRGHTLRNRANPVQDLSEMLPNSHFISPRQESTSQISRVDQDISYLAFNVISQVVLSKRISGLVREERGKETYRSKEENSPRDVPDAAFILSFRGEIRRQYSQEAFSMQSCFDLSILYEEEKVYRTENSPRNSNELSLYPVPTLNICQSFRLK
jgi:hypothetical protein